MSVMRDKFGAPVEEVCQELRPLLSEEQAGAFDGMATGHGNVRGSITGRPLAGYEVERRIYGYLIRRIERLPARVVMVQGGCMAIGMAMCLISAELLRRGSGDAGSGLWGTVAIIGALLFTLVVLRFATRGLLPHIEVDLKRGELREVIRHRIGRESLLQCIGFDAVKALRVLPRAGQAGMVLELTLYCHIETAAGPDLLEVASGTPDSISALSQLLRQNIKAVPVTGALPVPAAMVTAEPDKGIADSPKGYDGDTDAVKVA